jgi:hypothetical protein
MGELGIEHLDHAQPCAGVAPGGDVGRRARREGGDVHRLRRCRLGAAIRRAWRARSRKPGPDREASAPWWPAPGPATLQTARDIALPLALAVEDPAARDQIQQLVDQIEQLRELIRGPVAATLGFSLGFNATDGD